MNLELNMPHGGAVGVNKSEVSSKRLFLWMWWGVLLVPVPILLFALLSWAGLPVGVCEDLITVLVMVPLGGPHVIATFTRTFLNAEFRSRDPYCWWISGTLWIFIFLVAILSIFSPIRILGIVPIQWVLTGFFFWASIHILQQSLFALEWSEMGSQHSRDTLQKVTRPGPIQHTLSRQWWSSQFRSKIFGFLESVVVWTCLYPFAMLRMSISDSTGTSVNLNSIGGSLVHSFMGSEIATADYVFRIGRVVPILPEFMRTDLLWIVPSVIFTISLVAYLFFAVPKAIRDRRMRARVGYVITMAIAGLLVPLAPNLDTAFQGLNAWHCFQYLIMVWHMNRRDFATKSIQQNWFVQKSTVRSGLRYYAWLLGASTIGVAILFIIAGSLTWFQPSRFRLWEATPSLEVSTGFRPGAVLSSYYLAGFGALLVHYLQDTLWILRRDKRSHTDITGRQIQIQG